jgi:tetratricopeptide (TPR) repeat protein
MMRAAGSKRLCATLGATVLAAACAARSPLEHQECTSPDAMLAGLLPRLEELRAKGCTEECGRLRREIERMAVICPTHSPTLMANAVLAFDERRLEQSQQWLDQILGQSRPHADAAMLRARIAVEEGNLPFAHRLLEQHIRLVPDHAGLHETYGATLYLERDLAGAERALMIAAALGAPRWRIAYHLGLIEEGSGRFDDAIRHYTEALEGNPGWAAAQSRLNALRATRRPA